MNKTKLPNEFFCKLCSILKAHNYKPKSHTKRGYYTFIKPLKYGLNPYSKVLLITNCTKQAQIFIFRISDINLGGVLHTQQAVVWDYHHNDLVEVYRLEQEFVKQLNRVEDIL